MSVPAVLLACFFRVLLISCPFLRPRSVLTLIFPHYIMFLYSINIASVYKCRKTAVQQGGVFMAAIFLSPLYILVNIYIFRWIFLWLCAVCPMLQSTGFLIFLAFLYILLSTSPLTGFLVKKPSWLHSILKITGNFFLGFFLYFLLTVFTADIIRLIIKYCFRIPWSGSRLFFVLAGSICALIILFFCIYGISHVSHIKTKYYNIQI